ncbi:putative F-box/LRR-repeat protein at3g28410 [Phtheirospermum japonicum]|uniref:Putative F-box/LRR-repeat protein at3g28410 n=1 Tax=Phtheirospermum japonicum TaxID=374723 RepID=A0A830B5S7_9LAMI|nr:putative F-box/LRR-repeat protein at3g28410 [Phtheirospermum japonicum]
MATAGEIQFPEPIIHHLQSFLTRKEAARTTIVSKSWHSAWSTRPNLDFKERPCDYSRIDEFSKYAKKTIKRYEQSNLKIESFKLCMKINWYGRVDLAKKLIVKALKIGATRLSLRLNDRSNRFVLPHEVVFGAENLIGLSVKGCTINPDDDEMVIKCSRLESLSLDEVYIPSDLVSNIISSCPLIENLSLLSYTYSDYEYDDDEIENNGYEEAVGLVNNLGRLRCLVLGSVSFEKLFSGDDLLSKLPFLEDFTLYLERNNFEEVDIQISNCSLERIKLELEDQRHMHSSGKRPRVKLDVPSIRKFTFEGDVIPSLSLISTPYSSREWESYVSVKCQRYGGPTAFWFGELCEFLTTLRQSKTHLSLLVDNHNWTSFDYKVRDNIIQGLRKHELESLAINMRGIPSLNCYALLDGLFRLCRPKMITQYDKQQRYHSKYKRNIDFLCLTLEQGMKVKVSRPSQFMYGLNDLEEVNAQSFDVEWRPIPLESLLDIADEQQHQRVRLLLKWKPS